MENDFSELIKAAAKLPAPAPDFERWVMMEVARRAIERSRRKARRGMVATLSGLAMLLAGCIAAIVAWFPVLMPAFGRMSWLEKLSDIPAPKFLERLAGTTTGIGVGESAAIVPFFEPWGGLILIVLLIGGAAGFIYYLNSLFSSDYTPD